ncbi:DNA repair protein complementing XP-G cells homolog [Orussus abietinus]|uniref:DNA repair protein complementing XP-G cells homolog n=1 Tax=Orussus abietinus TaxID=222816 RepID=UPI0006269295|nr:DNA repair protein complementing XP-G cells homolog [Orussus abietinus]
MGVHGLWRLLDSTGKPVPLETLEGKVLAIDVSIWIHQVIQGYQDRRGNPVPNAHLLGLFHRICKLLYYKIKPIFVFDGGVPMLKKNTIAARRKQKSVAMSKAQRMKNDLINNLIKHSAVSCVLSADDNNKNVNSNQDLLNLKSGSSAVDDMFKLPVIPSTSKEILEVDNTYESDSSPETSPRKQTRWTGNIHSVDVSSTDFKALPADVRYDILTDLKETRKQNSWGRLHEMPDETYEFSSFQMKRLLKRRLVQESLEEAEKEMGGRTLTLEELETLLKEQGVSMTGRDAAYRIASDSTTRVLYIDNTKPEKTNSSNKTTTIVKDRETSTTSEDVTLIDDLNEYEFESDWDSDVELIDLEPVSKKYFGKTAVNPAVTYMLEYAGLTQDQIFTLLERNNKNTEKTSVKNLEASTSNFQLNETDVKIEEDEVELTTESYKNSESSQKSETALKSSSTDIILNISDVNNDFQKSNSSTSPSELNEFVKGRTELDTPQTQTPKSTIVQFAQPVETHKTSEYFDLVNSSSDSDDLVEVEKLERNQNKIIKPVSHKGHSTTITASQETGNHDKLLNTTTSDTDTDDFIEIQDLPIPDSIFAQKQPEKNSLQITVNCDQKPENDLFDDIFSDNVNPLSEPFEQNKTEQIKQKDTVNVTCIPSSDESIKLLENASQEQVVKPPDVSKEDQLKQATKKSEDKSMEPVSSQNMETEVNERTNAQTVIPQTDSFKDDSSLQITRTILPQNTEELLKMKTQLENEHAELAGDLGRLERQATDITDQMRIDAQELLRLFGIPYIVAPMEAEAQCAYLETIKLTDGTITDDSDIWLFGGQCVYKNFFNNNKRVLRFCSSDIQHHFSLTRRQMIQLALLVGSDYTMGLSGIGPVTALEVLAAFPSDGENVLRGLFNFCSWIKTGKTVGPGKTGLRNKLRNVKIDKGFPSEAVVQAYLNPTVDESKEGFSWSKPSLVLLADYTRQKFGWTRLKFEDIVGPVMKRLEESKSQKNLEAYFKIQTIPKSIGPNLSKRVQKVVQQLAFDNEEKVVQQLASDNEEKEEAQDQDEKSKKTKSKSKGRTVKWAINQAKEECISEKLNTNSDATTSNVDNVSCQEYIPQREKDKANALKNKLRAIEVFRKSRKGLAKAKRVKRSARKIVEEAALSESSSSS